MMGPAGGGRTTTFENSDELLTGQLERPRKHVSALNQLERFGRFVMSVAVRRIPAPPASAVSVVVQRPGAEPEQVVLPDTAPSVGTGEPSVVTVASPRKLAFV